MAKKKGKPAPRREPETTRDARDVEDALELAAKIESTIEDEVGDEAKDTAPDFFEDVLAKARSVARTIESKGRVTEGQKNALNNWYEGVRKWVHDD